MKGGRVLCSPPWLLTAFPPHKPWRKHNPHSFGMSAVYAVEQDFYRHFSHIFFGDVDSGEEGGDFFRGLDVVDGDQVYGRRGAVLKCLYNAQGGGVVCAEYGRKAALCQQLFHCFVTAAAGLVCGANGRVVQGKLMSDERVAVPYIAGFVGTVPDVADFFMPFAD